MVAGEGVAMMGEAIEPEEEMVGNCCRRQNHRTGNTDLAHQHCSPANRLMGPGRLDRNSMSRLRFVRTREGKLREDPEVLEAQAEMAGRTVAAGMQETEEGQRAA